MELIGLGKAAKEIFKLSSKALVKVDKPKIDIHTDSHKVDLGIDYGSRKNFAPIQKDFQTGLNNLILKLDRSDITKTISDVENFFKTHPGIEWNMDRRILENIPAEMWKNTVIKPAKQGIGIQIISLDAKGQIQHRIRIDKGNPHSEIPVQRVDHIEVRYNHDYVASDGTMIKSNEKYLYPDLVHIKGESFIKSDKWNKWIKKE
jgi:hypothetical protein